MRKNFIVINDEVICKECDEKVVDWVKSRFINFDYCLRNYTYGYIELGSIFIIYNGLHKREHYRRLKHINKKFKIDKERVYIISKNMDIGKESDYAREVKRSYNKVVKTK